MVRIWRIKHPRHGYHTVYSDIELKKHRALGWIPEEEEFKAEQDEQPVNAQQPVKTQRRRGRPPKLAKPIDPKLVFGVKYTNAD